MKKKQFVVCSECGKPLYSEKSMKAGIGSTCKHKKEHKNDPDYEINKRSIEQIIASIMQGNKSDIEDVKFCVNKSSYKALKKYDNQTFITLEGGMGILDIKKHFDR